MRRAIPYFVLLSVFSTASCDRVTWPTDENEILDVLERNKNRFLEIEAQMRADNIRTVSEHELQQASGDPVPSMVHLLLKINYDKYRSLLGPRSPYIFEISDGTFSVAIPDRDSSASRFLVWLKRDPAVNVERTCSTSITRMPCGTCGIQIDEEWSVHWQWVPHDPTYPDENCRAQRRVQ